MRGGGENESIRERRVKGLGERRREEGGERGRGE